MRDDPLDSGQAGALMMYAQGVSVAEIAQTYGVTTHRIYQRMGAAYRALGAKNRVHAFAIGAVLGIFDLDEIEVPDGVQPRRNATT